MNKADTKKNGYSSVAAVVSVYAVCFAFRIFEYFVLKTDRTFWGEAFIHKLCGIGVLFISLKFFSLTVNDIGFIGKKIGKNLVRGLVFGLSVFFVAYVAEILITFSQGKTFSVQWFVSSFAVNKNSGSETALIFFVICILGNMINVIMEEGVFRGLFQKLLERRFSFIASAVTASILFGLWHVVSPIRSFCEGTLSVNGLVANILMLVVTSSLVGFKFTLLTKMTGSLYMAMGDHFVNNTITNIVHIVSNSGTDELLFVRITIAQSLSFVMVLLYYLRHKNAFFQPDMRSK